LPLNINVEVSLSGHLPRFCARADLATRCRYFSFGDLDPPALTALVLWLLRRSQIGCGCTLDAPSCAETAVGACFCRLEKFFRGSSDSQHTYSGQCIDRYMHTSLYVPKPSYCALTSSVDVILANSKSPRPVHNSGQRECSINTYYYALF